MSPLPNIRWKLKFIQLWKQAVDRFEKHVLVGLFRVDPRALARLKVFFHSLLHHRLIAPFINQRKMWLFWACFLPVILLTIIQILRSPRIYVSSAEVQVEQWGEPAVKSMTGDADVADLRDEDSLKTIEQNLQNDSIFNHLVGDPKIMNDPDFLVGYAGNRNPVKPADVAGWLKSNTQVGLRHGTRLIDVSVEHRVPSMAQKLAQAVVEHFVSVDDEAQDSQREASHKLLATQSEQMRKNLQQSEDTLQIYKDALLVKDRIGDEEPVIESLQERYGEKNPQLVQAQDLLAQLRQTFDADFKKVMTTSETEASFWSTNRADLTTVSGDGDITPELKFVAARADILQKEVETESALFDNVLKQMRESGVDQSQTQTAIRLIQRPALPEKPSKPKKTIMLLTGVAIGTVLGVIAVALARALDSSIQNPAEAESLLGLHVVGAITELPPKKGVVEDEEDGASTVRPGANEDLVIVADPGGVAAEEFRSLRAAVKMLQEATPSRSLLFVSPFPREGKTFVSCNYALAVAQSKRKTLLIDADLRCPSVHRRLNLENKAGLADVLSDGADLRSLVHRQFAPNLDVLTAGRRCQLPAELLGGPEFERFLDTALASYECVIVDSSPVNMVSDALLIAGLVDAVFLIIRAGSTSRQAARHAVALLRRARKEPSGVVLNAVAPLSRPVPPRYEPDAPDTGRNYQQAYS